MRQTFDSSASEISMGRASQLCPPFAADLLAGDSPSALERRLGEMAAMPGRIAKVRDLATKLHYQVATKPLPVLLANGSDNSSPRMRVRHLHDLLVYKARGQHCHAGLYRSVNADRLLSAGGLNSDGDAVVHCEHTVPTGAVLAQLRLLFLAGRLRHPEALLTAFLELAVVTVLLKAENHGQVAGIHLAARRTFDGRSSGWKDKHPDIDDQGIATRRARPFRRYMGTGLQVLFVPSAELIDLETFTLADHAERIRPYKAYQAATYFTR